MSIAKRLQDELNRRKWSTRRFQQHVQAAADEDARGISYAAVHGYVNGTVAEPALSFMRIAARVLEVRLGWLIDGEGARTQAEADEDLVSEAALPEQWTKQLSEAIEAELGGPIPRVAHAWIAHHWLRMAEYAVYAEVPLEDLLKRLARAVTAPLRELGVDSLLEDLGEEGRGDYVVAIVPAVMRVIRLWLADLISDRQTERKRRVAEEGMLAATARQQARTRKFADQDHARGEDDNG